MAAISLVVGYISRVVTEKIECGRCMSLVIKAKGSSTGVLDDLIAHEDRGGLCYPAPDMVLLLDSLKRFLDIMLSDRASLHKPMETCLATSVEVVVTLPVPLCDRYGQRRRLMELVCKKFMKPLFTNHAFDFTDKKTVARLYQTKPFSFKFLKL